MEVSIKELEQLGFTVNEAKTYLHLIKLGPSLAGTIAKKANLDRSSTYNALNSLVNKGIISTAHENKRTTYIPSDPKKIIDYFKEKEEIAKRFLPSLKEQFQFQEGKKKIQLFQGRQGIKTVFQDILDSCDKDKECLVLGSEGQFKKAFPYYAPVYRKKKEEKKFKTKMLIREGREKTGRGKYTQYRRVPNELASPVSMSIYDHKLALFIWDDKPEALLIENKKVANTFQNYFHFIWKHAQKD
jgi:HTH-type transcriptional regulator, sugar sensing transcriptional regulator